MGACGGSEGGLGLSLWWVEGMREEVEVEVAFLTFGAGRMFRVRGGRAQRLRYSRAGPVALAS